MVANKKKGKSTAKPKVSKLQSKVSTRSSSSTAKGGKMSAKPKTTAKTVAKKVATKKTKSPPKIAKTIKTAKPSAAPTKASIKPSSGTKPKITRKTTEPKTAQKADRRSPVTKASPPSQIEVADLKSSRIESVILGKGEVSSFHESMMPYKFEPYYPKPNEEYMSDGQLKHFRGILDTWKRELMKEVDHTISEMKGASVLADPNDRATQEEAFNLELRTRDRERKLIRKIEEALQQIEDKEYGYCESCGVEIGLRRLEARPTAGLCIDCKTLAEIRERNIQ